MTNLTFIKELCANGEQQQKSFNEDKLRVQEEFLVKEGVFEKLPKTLKSFQEIEEFVSNSPELLEISAKFEQFEQLEQKESHIPYTAFNTKGDQVHYVTDHVRDDGGHIGFYVDQNNTIVHWSKVINCHGIQNVDTSLEQIKLFNKHGFNLELEHSSEEQAILSDSEIEESHSILNVDGPDYGEYNSCQEYAMSISGDRPSALQYCPEAYEL